MSESEKMQSIWLRLPPELVAQLDELTAQERRRSRAAQIQYMLEQYIEQNYVDDGSDEEE